MGNTVDIRGNANFQSVHRAWQLADARAESFNRQLLRIHGISGRNKQASDAFFASMNQGMMQFTQRVAGIGGALSGMVKLVQLIKSEYEHMKVEQAAKAGVQVTAAKAQRAAILNLPADDNSLNVAQLNQRVNQIATKEGVSPATLYDAAAAAFSSKGASVQSAAALEAVEISAKLQPEDAETIQQNTQAILAIKKRSPDTSMKDIAGFLIASQQASRQVGVREFAENAAPAIAQAVDFGDSLQFASGLYATITQGAEDAMGRVSRNAMVRFQQQLLTETAAAGRTDLKTTEERLAYVRSNEGSDLRAKLLGALDTEAATADKAGLAGEAKAFMTLVGLLQPLANDQQKLLQDNLALIPQLDGAAKVLEQTLMRVNREAIQQTASAERIGKSSAEVARLINTKSAQAAVVRQQLADLRAAMGSTDLGIKAQTLLEDLNSNGQPDFAALDAGVVSLKSAIMDVTRSFKIPSQVPFGAPTTIEGRGLTPLEQEQINTLDRLRESIANLRAEQAGAAPVNEGRLQDELRQRTEAAAAVIERLSESLPEGVVTSDTKAEFAKNAGQSPELAAVNALQPLVEQLRGNAAAQSALEAALLELRNTFARSQVAGERVNRVASSAETDRASRLKSVRDSFSKVAEYSGDREGTQAAFDNALQDRATADRSRAPELIGAELLDEFRNRFPVGIAQDSLTGAKREMLDQRAAIDGIQATSPERVQSVQETLGRASFQQPELETQTIGRGVSQMMSERPELDPARIASELAREQLSQAPEDLKADYEALIERLDALRQSVDASRQDSVAMRLNEMASRDSGDGINNVQRAVIDARQNAPELDPAAVALEALKEEISIRQSGDQRQQSEAIELTKMRGELEAMIGVNPAQPSIQSQNETRASGFDATPSEATPSRETSSLDIRAVDALTRGMATLTTTIGRLIEAQGQAGTQQAMAARGEAPLYQPRDRYREKAAMRESRYFG